MRKRTDALLRGRSEKLSMAGHFSRLVLCVVALLSLVPLPAYGGDRLIVGGSGNNLAGVELLARAFQKTHPDVAIDVPASLGSTGGIRAAAEGAVSLGLVSRSLRRSEEDLGLTVVPYARTAVVIAVNASVPESQITSEELLDVYAGRKTAWRNGSEIVVFLRDPDDSTTELLKAAITGFSEVYEESRKERRWITLYTDQDMNKLLVTTPYSIGFSDTGSIASGHLPIKILALDGVFPSPGNIRRRRYPLVKLLSFVFVQSRLSSTAQAFIDFVKSREGKRILMDSGYFPVD